MTGARRAATALAALAWTVGGAAAARAQTQPPRFEAHEGNPATPPRVAPPSQPASPPATAQSPATSSRPAPPPATSSRPATPPPAEQPRPRRTQPDDPDAIDDPKVSRRLGTRSAVPPPPPVAPPPARPPRVEAAAAPPPPPPVQPIATPTEVETGVPTLQRPYTPVAETSFEPTLPRLKLALRRFDFVQIGASESSNGVAAPETFNSFSVDVYPVSRIVRVGLSTAFGWQSGTWLANGDYFATQSVSLGAQYGGLGRFVPFVEGFAGVGYMRRLQFDRTIPTAFWQFGADAGVEIYLTKVGFLSFAIGYLRPVNGFARRQQFTTVFVDTWSFKIGVGI
jgi:hypothetical protein